MIVDDEPFNLHSMRILLELAFKDLEYPLDLMMGQIDTAKNGLQYINKVKEAHE